MDDLNGDGISDLAVANCWVDTISIFLGNGDGTFQTAVDYATGGRPECVVMGDLNGDEISDIAVENTTSSNISILLGNGDGTFQTGINYAAGYWPKSVVMEDLDSDGKLDLAVANQMSDTVYVLINTTPSGDSDDSSGCFITAGARGNARPEWCGALQQFCCTLWEKISER